MINGKDKQSNGKSFYFLFGKKFFSKIPTWQAWQDHQKIIAQYEKKVKEAA